MFRKRTTFIVGAGASAEAKFPIGDELAAQLAAQLCFEYDDLGHFSKGDRGLISCLRTVCSRGRLNLDTMVAKSQFLSKGLALTSSIDAFLHSHSDDPNLVICGKLAIVNAILRAEKSATIFIRDGQTQISLATEVFRNTWYWKFVDQLLSGIQRTDLNNLFDNVSVICFNYDRCIEQVLRLALVDYFGLNTTQVEDLVAKLVIVHPYGTVGSLKGNQSVRFGADPAAIDLLQSAEQIRIFTEQTTDSQVLSQLHRLLIEAENVVFLGFGFLEQNMSLMKPDEEPGPKQVFATVYGTSSSQQKIYEGYIRQLFWGTRRFANGSITKGDSSIVFSGEKCAKFLGDYGREIADY